MKNITLRNLWFVLLLTTGFQQVASANPLEAFKENPAWKTTVAASAVGDKLQVTNKAGEDALIIYNGDKWAESGFLLSKTFLSDALVEMEYLIPGTSTAKLYLQGRYAVELTNKNNEWQTLSVRYRAPRYDEARNKTDNALILDVHINGELVQKNVVFEKPSKGTSVSWEDEAGHTGILAQEGPIAVRNVKVLPADFTHIIPPAESGQATNEEELVDFVALGKDAFESVGCNVCHSIQSDYSAVSTGPNVYGLFTNTPRDRDIIEGGEKHRFTIKADSNYLRSSIRTPEQQIAIGEHGAQKGEAYPPIMPPFPLQVLSDVQIDAIGAYLLTLNKPGNQGPVIKLMPQTGQQAYDPLDDNLQSLVTDKTRIQRGPLPGVSGRTIHVGQTNGVNYSFDPRTLAIAKIWQGGFLDMGGEFQNRGGKGLKTGYESREIELGETQALLAPLNSKGEAIDFSFKNAKFGDIETIRESLNSKQDHLQRIAQEDAQFLGYEIDSKKKTATPTFRYRIGKNTLAVNTEFSANGETQIRVTGELKSAQTFSVNTGVLQQAHVSAGELSQQQWTLPAGKIDAKLTAKVALATNVWRAPPTDFDYRKQPIRITKSSANLPAGYSIESYYPPKDNYGREQLFEALGLALADDGTVVVATRTAGIWRMVKGQWQLFAEGTFDSLGVVIEDKKGLQVVVGQKAELTRISDTNGDGIADKYETLFDAHSYHGNYHSYMHGPARGSDGAYYISINLADAGDGSAYKAGGQYMGSSGGFPGWSFRVEPDGKYETWGYGLRSPAGMAQGPDGRLWYSENQGEYVGTSKIFILQKDRFYGHPSALVDFPGMTPDSPEIQWEKVADKVEPALILLPHNKVANSPGNPAWDTTKGKFGPFASQMLIGDQTQSNLLRVSTEVVNGTEQGSVMPFIDGLESGVMRPLFLADGSLLLGQTGRGWQAKGGHVASLQRIRWDGKTAAPAIHHVAATSKGFAINLTQPLNKAITAEQLSAFLAIESWVYRDAPDYGSEEMDSQQEKIAQIKLSEDRKQLTVDLVTLEHKSVHPQQTARVYHLTLSNEAANETTNQKLFSKSAPKNLEAYYTLYTFAK